MPATSNKPPRLKVPDSVILNMRYQHEVERCTMRDIHRKYPQHHINYIRAVLGYEVRAKLKGAL